MTCLNKLQTTATSVTKYYPSVLILGYVLRKMNPKYLFMPQIQAQTCRVRKIQYQRDGLHIA